MIIKVKIEIIRHHKTSQFTGKKLHYFYSMKLDNNYWNERYISADTGWDIGHVSPPLKMYLNKLASEGKTNLAILIPGCGNGYEAEYAHRMGFTQVFPADYAPEALKKFAERVPDFPKEHLLEGDFFEIKQQFDLILEQTFFCAINPELRDQYVDKCAALLVPGGTLAGLLFNDPLNQDQPPFGGSKDEYLQRFSRKFEILQMDITPYSIEPRAGRELFFELCRKD
ncbi:MAG TPA: methyltransferase domain-containing protein [Flavobacteriales bacterium]|nr:methyltransferase domain-containing protein [Flavobacteriales bacterium]